MRWDCIERHKIFWSKLWNMETNVLSFIVGAMYDVLPSPANLYHWCREDPVCHQWVTLATLKHIVCCKNSLIQRRYIWCHNQVLRCLASTLEHKRLSTNAIPLNIQTTFPYLASFNRKGAKQQTKLVPPHTCLTIARDWEMCVNLNQRLNFPPEIAVTELHPNLVLWSNLCHCVFIIELTVP